jgi:hypothetical protein
MISEVIISSYVMGVLYAALFYSGLQRKSDMQGAQVGTELNLHVVIP